MHHQHFHCKEREEEKTEDKKREKGANRRRQRKKLELEELDVDVVANMMSPSSPLVVYQLRGIVCMSEGEGGGGFREGALMYVVADCNNGQAKEK